MSFARRPLFFTETDGRVICDLCPKKCDIKNGHFGVCGVRGNKGGRGIIPFSGFITSLANDPIEKKPLLHFNPGTRILSLGFTGCNLNCPFCQNWRISQNTDVPGKYMTPEEIVSAAFKYNSPSVAYTYSEPLVHAEYVLECMKIARGHGLANVLVTNGCVNYNVAEEFFKLTDAINVDLKTISSDMYKKTLGGELKTVLDFIRLGAWMGVHIEVTTLVVPGLNDTAEELDEIARFIAGLREDIPWHLTAYHPEYRWNAPPTDRDFLVNAAIEARKILRYVHTGNI